MSARFVPTPSEAAYGSLPHGPPPGLPYPHGRSNVLRPEDATDNARVVMNDRGLTHGEPFSSLSLGREVSVPSPVLIQCGKSAIGIDTSSALLLSS
jgi:hypothetical protein